jgi:peptidoglycan/xylan/chitin deacetylase (PgdA/CDA1 family)
LTALKKTLKRLAFGVMAGSGLNRLLYGAFHRGHLAVLMYHAVVRRPLPVYDWCFLSEEVFAGHLRYLRDRCDVLPLEEAIRRLRAGQLHRPTVAITLDDGFQNNYDVAYPLLREHGMPATVFLTTGLIDTDRTVWFCRLLQGIVDTRRDAIEWEGERFPLGTPCERSIASARLQARLKRLPQPRLLEKLDEIEDRLGSPRNPSIPADSPFRILGRAALADLAADGSIAFGAHTDSHAILSLLDETEQRREIRSSLDAVAAATGRPCRFFSYPNGRIGDYNGRTLGVLRACGISDAFTSIDGPNLPATPPLELFRYGVSADIDPSDFAMTVFHAKNRLRWLVK